MYFLMPVESADYQLITKAHSIIGDFYVAARRYVAANPELKAAMDNVENKTATDEKITTAVATMKFQLAEELLTAEFAHETPSQQEALMKRLEIKCAIVEAQAFDHFIGLLEHFTSANILSTHILPAAAKDFPVTYSTVMQKYGMKKTANIIMNHLALQQG